MSVAEILANGNDMTFQLDTNGAVLPVNQDDPILSVQQGYTWLDLDAFTQGYVAAMFQAHFITRPAFDMLAPETLARIIADCEVYQTAHRSALNGMDGPRRPDATPHNDGRMFWHWRNKPGATSYSPLTVELGDDGKVRFGELV